MPPRNRKGRTAESIVRDMLPPIEPARPTPNPVASPERKAAFDEKWKRAASESISLPKVTRVEIIDAAGRDVTRRYIQAGVTISVQDDSRTIKIFAGEKSGGSTRG